MAPSREDVGKTVSARLAGRQVNWLAAETGMDRTAISAIKNGRGHVGIVIATRLQAALGGKLSDYITDPRAYARAVAQEEPAGAAAAEGPDAERFASLERRLEALERQAQHPNRGSA